MEKYLQLTDPRLIKQYLVGWLIMINLLGIPTSIYGFLNSYTKIFLLPIIIINIWAVYLLIGVEKKQKEYELFVGVFCTIMSIILMVSSFILIQSINEFPLKGYIIISSFIYFAILFFGGIYHKIALKKGYYFKKSSKSRTAGGIIIAFSGLGLFIGRVLAETAIERTKTIILALCALILGYLLELGIHNIYKYYLIKKNDKLV